MVSKIFGDKNAKFYHDFTIVLNGTNKIKAPKNSEGVWVFDEGLLEAVVQRYCKSLVPADIAAIDTEPPPCLYFSSFLLPDFTDSISSLLWRRVGRLFLIWLSSRLLGRMSFT